MYEKALLEDLALIKELKQGKDYLGYGAAFARMGAFARLSAKKDENVFEEKKERVKELREQVKSSLKLIQEQYFYQSPEQMAEDMKGSRKQMEVLLELAAMFYRRFTEKKRRKTCWTLMIWSIWPWTFW